MASKPVSVPRWGETVAGVVGPNEAEPLETKKDGGWVPGEEPPAEYWNWYKRLVYKWIAYLKDGIFAADAASGADAVNATGDGTGAGVNAFGGATGPGIQAEAGGGLAAPVRGALAVVPVTADPTAPVEGDVWFRSGLGLFAKIGAAIVHFADQATVDAIPTSSHTWGGTQTFSNPIAGPSSAPIAIVRGTPYISSVDCAYWKDATGEVHLRGAFSVSGTPATSVMFVLPLGFRPVNTRSFIVNVGGTGAVAMTAIDIGADGSITTHDATNAHVVSVDGIHFLAEP